MNAIYLTIWPPPPPPPPPLPPGHKIARKAIQTKVKIVFVCALYERVTCISLCNLSIYKVMTSYTDYIFVFFLLSFSVWICFSTLNQCIPPVLVFHVQIKMFILAIIYCIWSLHIQEILLHLLLIVFQISIFMFPNFNSVFEQKLYIFEKRSHIHYGCIHIAFFFIQQINRHAG